MGLKESLLGFAEKVGDAVDKGVKTSKESYNKMAEKSRINKEMKQLTNDITNIFSSVGRRLYTENPENETFAVVFGEVKEKEDQIEKLKQQLNALEGMVTCSGCGEQVQQTANVCPNCGTPIEHPAEPEPEVMVGEVVNTENADAAGVCPVCGAELESDAKFCKSCGAKVEK